MTELELRALFTLRRWSCGNLGRRFAVLVDSLVVSGLAAKWRSAAAFPFVACVTSSLNPPRAPAAAAGNARWSSRGRYGALRINDDEQMQTRSETRPAGWSEAAKNERAGEKWFPSQICDYGRVSEKVRRNNVQIFPRLQKNEITLPKTRWGLDDALCA